MITVRGRHRWTHSPPSYDLAALSPPLDADHPREITSTANLIKRTTHHQRSPNRKQVTRLPSRITLGDHLKDRTMNRISEACSGQAHAKVQRTVR